MKHLVVLLSLLLAWTGAQAQTEKQTIVTKLPGEENLSLRERAERDFLMPVRRKKAAEEAPKAVATDNTAAPESDATAHYAETADEAREAVVPAHTTSSYEARHTEWLAARRAVARREESRAEARAEARRAARHSRSARSTRAHSKAIKHSSKAKSKASKAKAAARTKASKSHKASKAKSSAHHSSAKRSSAHKAAKKHTPAKSKAKSKAKSRHR